jgi:hypothetical protein
MRRWWWLIVIVVAFVLWFAFCRGDGARTRMEIESHGGFAYIPDRPNNLLEIVYLGDLNVEGCEVDQVGTELQVVDGNIVEVVGADIPADKKFSLNGTVVTFPDLESSALTLTAVRGNRPNGGPGNPNDAAEWADLKWIAGIGPDFPKSSRNPNWKALPVVDGRMTLKGGQLTAAFPSDPAAQTGVFEFKDAASSKFTQAMTDRTYYTVDVPRNRVVMQLTGSKITRIVVEPRPDRPVQLKLIGLHTKNGGSGVALGAPISHYCAFYQLLDPIPPVAEWLIPHFAGNPTLPPDKAEGQPSPGPYCPGQWGPE